MKVRKGFQLPNILIKVVLPLAHALKQTFRRKNSRQLFWSNKGVKFFCKGRENQTQSLSIFLILEKENQSK